MQWILWTHYNLLLQKVCHLLIILFNLTDKSKRIIQMEAKSLMLFNNIFRISNNNNNSNNLNSKVKINIYWMEKANNSHQKNQHPLPCQQFYRLLPQFNWINYQVLRILHNFSSSSINNNHLKEMGSTNHNFNYLNYHYLIINQKMENKITVLLLQILIRILLILWFLIKTIHLMLLQRMLTIAISCKEILIIQIMQWIASQIILQPPKIL